MPRGLDILTVFFLFALVQATPGSRANASAQHRAFEAAINRILAQIRMSAGLRTNQSLSVRATTQQLELLRSSRLGGVEA
mmetsp:Transcript_17988/g.51513  ORF Transcript_17988/g.51513 Transcript_17988/m.51513 type:complete len:80 (-) Transcript_17988:59-298(-)